MDCTLHTVHYTLHTAHYTLYTTPRGGSVREWPQGPYLGGVHDDGGHEVEEDVVAVGAVDGVAGGHLQLVHGLQQEALSLVLQVLKGRLLVEERGNTERRRQ